jgi:hypothetical protein
MRICKVLSKLIAGVAAIPTQHEAGNLRYGDWITAADLDRAVSIITSAERLLSVENSITTFPKLIELNRNRDTLIFASSFPTTAVKLLLTKLRPTIQHHHFGDTDAAGYFIQQNSFSKNCAKLPCALSSNWQWSGSRKHQVHI